MMTIHNPREFQGPIFEQKYEKTFKVMVFDDVAHEIHNIICHRFKLTIEAGPSTAIDEILRWLDSEPGKWIVSKSIDTPIWHRQQDVITLDFEYAITAKLKGIDYTFWAMKWAN